MDAQHGQWEIFFNSGPPCTKIFRERYVVSSTQNIYTKLLSIAATMLTMQIVLQIVKKFATSIPASTLIGFLSQFAYTRCHDVRRTGTGEAIFNRSRNGNAIGKCSTNRFCHRPGWQHMQQCNVTRRPPARFSTSPSLSFGPSPLTNDKWLTSRNFNCASIKRKHIRCTSNRRHDDRYFMKVFSQRFIAKRKLTKVKMSNFAKCWILAFVSVVYRFVNQAWEVTSWRKAKVWPSDLDIIKT
jgi:hypothetical protein